nr:glycosyltransferase [Parahaliea mediterranea]
MRVAVISDSPPERNGVGSYYADLVEQLGQRIERSELLCPTGNQSRLYRYLLPPLPGDSTQKIWLPNPLGLWRRLSALRPHVVVVPTPGPYGIAGLVTARRLGIPVITGFHTHYEALAGIYWATAFGRLSQWYLTRSNQLLFRLSHLVLANSPDMIQQARRFGANRVELMGTSVAGEFLHTPLVPPRPRLRRVLFIGRLAEEKNLPAVLDAAARLPDLQFTVAGDGPLRRTVGNAAQRLPNLHYIGWRPRSALVHLLDEHDLLILPSRVESFGTVALEAMARGRLALVSEACGIVDWAVLANGLFVIGKGESAWQALERIAGLPAEARARKSGIARRAALELNNWNLRRWLLWLQEAGQAQRH